MFSETDIKDMEARWDTLDILPNTHPLGANGESIPYDSWYEEGLGEIIFELCLKYEIDVVFCSYVFQSKLLEFVPPFILKVIDTHDKMGNRYEMLRAKGLPLEFFSCTPEEEGAYLRRADIVVARREEEARYFDSVTGRSTAIVVPHLEEPKFIEKSFSGLHTVGIVASANLINLKIVREFLEAIDCRLQGDACPFTLHLAGQLKTIIELLPLDQAEIFQKTWVNMHGFVPDIAQFYADMDLIVSPVTMGTGINVKTVQAMAFGMPLLTTSWGAKGIESHDPQHSHPDLKTLAESLISISRQNATEELERLAEVSRRKYTSFFEESSLAMRGMFEHEKLSVGYLEEIIPSIANPILTPKPTELKSNDPLRGPLPDQGREARGRILIIDETFPMPDQDSGSLDAYYLQKTLSEIGYKVTFAPEDLMYLEGYTEQFQQMGVECLYTPNVPTLKHYLMANGKAFDFVFLTRANAANRNFNTIKRLCPKAKIIFNTVDLHHLRQEREAAVTGSAEMAGLAKQMKVTEFDLMRKCDMTIVISEAEAQLLRQQDASLRLTVMPFMREIPGCKCSFSERKDIVFIGGFEHLPNIDSVEYFVKEIWPLIRSSLPEVQFLIIGSKMPDHIKALETHAGVVVVGFVQDLAEYFDHCKMTVVPLRFGAGIKGKIGTSASFGVPSIATTIAVEGMGFVDGEDVLVADDPATFAELVVRLYQDEPLWIRLSQSCLAKINEQYSLEMGKKRLEELLNAIGGR
ncbi:MAG: glycosyltransferase [Proteobacteria bacterium]|nr:glycosyltransferase [Pseudomonadota bacterium]